MSWVEPEFDAERDHIVRALRAIILSYDQNGRASCRERV